MQLGVHVPNFKIAGGTPAIAPELVRVAEAAEAAGVTWLSVMDHYFQMDRMAPAEHPMLEGYTTLGFLAAHTSTIRLGLLVTGVTYRHPGLLAKVVSTLDVLSGGRAALGIGAAWYEREHRGLGVPFPPIAERFERLEETLQICLQMWDPTDNGAFEGRHYQLAETLCSPAAAEPAPSADHRSAAAASGRRCGWWPSTPTPATCSRASTERSRTSSTCCAGTATTWVATTRPSTRRSCTSAVLCRPATSTPSYARWPATPSSASDR